MKPILIICLMVALTARGATFQNEFVTNPPANPVTGPIIFKGPLTGTNVVARTNLIVDRISFSTNVNSTTVTIQLSRSTSYLSTNNNLAFTGYSGLDGTNGGVFTLIITNTAGSASPKSITFPVGTQILASPWTNVVYNTNQGVFSGTIDPLAGTNATWTGF